jgi:hypothetical protein
LLCIDKAQQRPCMALRQPLTAQPLQHILRQAKKPQLVCHSARALAKPSRSLLLTEPKQPDQATDSFCFLHKNLRIAPLDFALKI